MQDSRVSVVLIDDSVDVRTLVRLRLEASGAFDVVGEGADGTDAVELLLVHEPDLVLLDVSTPVMDGLETLSAVLAIRPETHVVMFTGFGGADLVAKVRELGALDLVEKSIPLDQLPDRLLQVLHEAVHAPDGEPGPAPAPASPPRALRLVEDPDHEVMDLAAVEQEVLDEHVEGFRALFERAAIGMATLTVDATIVRANAALARLMSCEPADLVGVDYGRLAGGQGHVLDHRLESLRLSDGAVATFEHPLPVAPGAGAARTALVTLVPIRDSHGQVLYVFAQVQDITAQRTAETELHRSEERFRLLVDVVEEYAIYMLDTDGVVLSWNAGARRIKGYQARDVVGRHFRIFYPVEDQLTGHPERNLEAALEHGSYAEEGWRVRQDGTRFWASVVITAMRDDRGTHVGFTKVTRDQTEQRENAEQRSEAMAEQSRLLALTAHELRNPVAVIDGSAHALMDATSLTPAERGQLLRGIRSSADRLRRFATDLATTSQIQGAGMHFRRRTFSLTDLVHATAARRRSAIPSVHVDVDAPEEVVVHADEVRLGQALDNLVDNAVRHGAGPVRLAVRAEGEQVAVEVTDGGDGVPAELVPRLYDRFATAGPSSGTGLGLYLVREIAARHDGEVAYTAPGEGRPTTFTVRIPLPADT
ncbi:hybrid sensor histidine kinase/response regulator [Nocardioides zeicaulis]|uniref:histidine kinase n=1 Tax=Nocardioides zeicaulis TaxID=1776857 RepID=A0ABV6E6L8_9ACTN